MTENVQKTVKRSPEPTPAEIENVAYARARIDGLNVESLKVSVERLDSGMKSRNPDLPDWMVMGGVSFRTFGGTAYSQPMLVGRGDGPFAAAENFAVAVKSFVEELAKPFSHPSRITVKEGVWPGEKRFVVPHGEKALFFYMDPSQTGARSGISVERDDYAYLTGKVLDSRGTLTFSKVPSLKKAKELIADFVNGSPRARGILD